MELLVTFVSYDRDEKYNRWMKKSEGRDFLRHDNDTYNKNEYQKNRKKERSRIITYTE